MIHQMLLELIPHFVLEKLFSTFYFHCRLKRVTIRFLKLQADITLSDSLVDRIRFHPPKLLCSLSFNAVTFRFQIKLLIYLMLTNFETQADTL